MQHTNIEITKSTMGLALRFGVIDNSDFAVDFFQCIKDELGIEIMLADYFAHREDAFCQKTVETSERIDAHLHCRITNPSYIALPELVTEETKTAIWSIFDKLLNKYNVNLEYDVPIRRRISITDFTYDARWFLIESSNLTIKKYLYSTFGFDTICFPTHNDGFPTHFIAFKSEKDKDSFISNQYVELLRARFKQYTNVKDHWKVFKDIEYSPIISLTSDLTPDQRYALARDDIL